MILRVNDTPKVNVSMSLSINYELEYIEIVVSVHNKEKGTIRTKTFPAAKFSEALAYMKNEERMWC